MKLSKLQVYDPPTLICTCGACDPNPELVRFANDLDWLRQQGVEVERYNLSSHPDAFAQQEAVSEALKNEGSGCL
ncbi:MAG: arsenic metallochaperone ArsD family protein, partial [Calditrichota bacterium]